MSSLLAALIFLPLSTLNSSAQPLIQQQHPTFDTSAPSRPGALDVEHPLTSEALMIQDFKNYANEALDLLKRNPDLKSVHDTIQSAFSTSVTVNANEFIGSISDNHVMINHNLEHEGASAIVINPLNWDPLEPKKKRHYALLTYATIVGVLAAERKLIVAELDRAD